MKNPAVIAILELLIHGATVNRVRKRLGKTDWIRAKATGFSSDIWLLWDKSEIELEVIWARQQYIHMNMNPSSGEAWELAIVYTSQNRIWQKELWNILAANQPNKPWLLMEDFNSILYVHE